MRTIHADPQLQVHLVSDGVYLSDGGAMFGLVPKTLWSRHVVADELNRIPLALNCLVVRDGPTTIVVDTGYGAKLSEKQLGNVGMSADRRGLLDDLAELGIEPQDVEIVINTHLHGDHCGGNTRIDNGHVLPTFPLARYVVQRIEWSEALFPNERTRATYLRDNLDPIVSQLELINGDTRVTPRVRTMVTRGHTASHQCVVIEPDSAPPIVFLADLTPRRIHLEKVAWVPAVDVLPLDSLESKRSMGRWLAEHGALAVLQHEPETPVGRVEVDGEGFRLLPE